MSNQWQPNPGNPGAVDPALLPADHYGQPDPYDQHDSYAQADPYGQPGAYAPVVGAPPFARAGAPMPTADPREAALAAAETAFSAPPAPDQNGLSLHPRSAVDVLSGLSDKVSRGAVSEYQPIPLGMSPLDRTLGGGIRSGELLLIGGAQGTGKTTMSLQMARNIAQSGQATVLYVCFEHDEEYLLSRMVAMESALSGAMPPNPNSSIKIQDVRREVLGTWLAQGGGSADAGLADLRANPRLRPALERIGRFGQSLFLLRGSHSATTAANLRRLVEAYRRDAPTRPLVIFVDYLQRVPVVPDPPDEAEKVTNVVAGLKDIALSLGVAVVAIVAADKEGLKAARLRNHHLRGSSALNYESDVILILNEKYSIVAKVNIEFNPYQAQRFRDWTILTVEKNRSGRDAVDLEFEKHFEFSCFDPNGRQVQEKLIEERLYND